MKPGIVGSHEGIHEARFVRAFRQRGAMAEFVSFHDLEALSIKESFRDYSFFFGGPLHLNPSVLAWLTAVPFIAVSYAYDVLYEARQCPKSAANVSAMLDASRGLVADCQAVASAVQETYQYSKPILVRPWGLERMPRDHFLNKSMLRPCRDFLGSGNIVVSVRNFTNIHRVMDVVLGFNVAIAVNPSLRLVLAGDGPLRDSISRIVADLGLSERVLLLGALPEYEVVTLIANADLYVSASASDGTSISLLQALESGVPVVLSNVGGNPEWANRVAGADLFEVGDYKRLGGLIAARIGGRRFDRSSVIEEFADWDKNANEILDFCCLLAN
jgi:glycosyltransferase involved in cell wall biosynthesis